MTQPLQLGARKSAEAIYMVATKREWRLGVMRVNHPMHGLLIWERAQPGIDQFESDWVLTHLGGGR